ncbi:tyrosine phosphatase family protein [Caulobacter sp. 17J80-11]|uniref:tyrosine phosphatase family protein n=1 Tax=Caulobacter sp. 17J80-11 TaxID=2763502 RepID=UPI001653E4BB|nr:hypothetical protein [Caulobacter sp. 17J80-11]MBC6981819.1 hypothetical protein [Caulobacter sp. 17J80-11]
MTIIVCPLSYVDTIARTRKPSHLVTLLDPDHEIETPEGIAPERHLRLGCHDVSDYVEGLNPPDATVVRQLLSFGAGWNASAPIVVHCWAGISRSSAAAFVLACQRNPHASEHEIAFEIRRKSRYATPNPRIVELADMLMARQGRMIDAAHAIGRGELAHEGRPFDLKADW